METFVLILEIRREEARQGIPEDAIEEELVLL